MSKGVILIADPRSSTSICHDETPRSNKIPEPDIYQLRKVQHQFDRRMFVESAYSESAEAVAMRIV